MRWVKKVKCCVHCGHTRFKKSGLSDRKYCCSCDMPADKVVHKTLTKNVVRYTSVPMLLKMNLPTYQYARGVL